MMFVWLTIFSLMHNDGIDGERREKRGGGLLMCMAYMPLRYEPCMFSNMWC